MHALSSDACECVMWDTLGQTPLEIRMTTRVGNLEIKQRALECCCSGCLAFAPLR